MRTLWQNLAILVGIKHYADKGFRPLQGPVSDVALIKSWLMSPSGGNLQEANIRTIISADPPPNLPTSQMPPLAMTFWNEFQSLVLDADGLPNPRPDSRLYLYFSGHGFSQLRDQMPRASLYAANANRVFCDNIPGTFCAFWAKDAGLFRDIVLIMDCCRDAEFAKTEAVPGLLQISTGVPANVPVFGIYAAPKGGKAQERIIASRNNDVHGLLTHALVDALEHAPSNGVGLVTSQDISNHIRTRWQDVCGEVPADPPEFFQPPGGPIVMVDRSNSLIPQAVHVSAWAPGETVELLDGRLLLLARLKKSDDGLSASIQWMERPPETQQLEDDRVIVRLAGGFFVLQRNGRLVDFRAGESHADIVKRKSR